MHIDVSKPLARWGLILFLAASPTLLGQHDHQHGKPQGAGAPAQANAPATATQHQHGHGTQQGADSTMNDATNYLLRLGSGTSLNPSSWPMPMAMTEAGSWNLMWMGQGFLVGTQQSGPRGGDKFYAANWGMLAAARNAGRGSVMLRGMVSLEPLTVSGRRYPLLFQTGEGAYGEPIVDGQHPHDLLMELSVHYARPVGERGMVNLYYAPVGDVALGPIAFPHRASAMEMPQATLGHHWQDSTHIANNVATAGFRYGKVRLETSGFRGEEPNENRWNIDMGPMDSWSTRLTYEPGPNWVTQVSTGRIKRPEAFHPDDVVRTTASVQYTRPVGGGAVWSSGLIWARNYKTVGKYATQAALAETVMPFGRGNYVTGRFEWSQRDELFENEHNLAHEIFEQTGKRAFNVAAYTVGYTRDLGTFNSVETGLGFNITACSIASALKPFYGDRPVGVSVFLRFRLRAGE
jgi:hypothetical protein